MSADWQAAGFGVYIHWPFCLAKCPYCDFNSHVSRSVDHGNWCTALIAEARAARALSGPRRADTIFFGGGTPSLMAPSTVAALIEEVDRLWGLAPDAEITLEANPTSVEAIKFRAYADSGVNRVSLGVQALDDTALRALGRMHTADEALAALGTAREVFDRVSFDLIYARSGQTLPKWRTELEQAVALGPDHLSLYQLTIEPGTRFAELHAAGKLVVPGEHPAAEMYSMTQEMTSAVGLPAYEVSNHARPGAESRHNLIYWRYGDYAGIGPGAHGRLTRPDGARVATETHRDPARWLDAVTTTGSGLVSATPLSGSDQAAEYMLMSMRLSEGADARRYHTLAGVPLPDAALDRLAASGHIIRKDARVRTTPPGRLVLNRVLEELLV